MQKDLSIPLLCDYYGGLLTEKQREAIHLYYSEDLSLGEMAEQLAISRQGARDNIQRATEKLHEYETVFQLAHKAIKAEDLLKKLAKTVKESSANSLEKQAIENLIDQIKDLIID